MMKNVVHRVTAILLMAIMMMGIITPTAFAVGSSTAVPGMMFEFGKDDHYDFSATSGDINTSSPSMYGSFSINANVLDTTTKDGVSAYKIDDGKMSIM